MVIEVLSKENNSRTFLSSGLVSVGFEPVGRWFEACVRRQRHGKTLSVSAETCEDLAEEEDDCNEVKLTRDDMSFMLSLNSKECKKQDHYRVLGIKTRFTATDEDIKKAYRKMVLRHHPDKKKHNKNKVVIPGLNEHEYFTCITHAYETLSNPTTRRAYDSIDPMNDDEIPSATSKSNFFDTYRAAFERNSRWSSKKPVPLLGDMNSTEDEVDEFYTFWYRFESWREFSYHDEEDKDQAESREERRWMEKQNRRKRQIKKKEELARIRSLVDYAYASDPRLKKFQEEKRQKKLQEKRAKEEALQEKERLRLEAEEAEKREKERAEQEMKQKAAKEKKEREKMKKATTKEKKAIRQVLKEHNYFTDTGMDLVKELEKLERTLENLTLENLQEMREVAEKKEFDQLKAKYLQHVAEVAEKLRKTEAKLKETKLQQAKEQQAKGLVAANIPWSDDEMHLLVKATTLFPVGTASRWQVIANYINEHSSEPKNRTSKQVINQVKSLQKLDPTVKEEVNKRAFEKLSKKTASKVAAKPVGGVTLRDDTSNIKGLRLEQHPTASNIKGLRLEQHPTASNIKGLRLEQHPTASNIKDLRLEQHPTASNIKGLRLEQHPTASNIKDLRLEQHPTASNIKDLRLEQHPTASNIKGLRLEQHPTASNIKGLRLEQHPTASNIKGLRLEQHPTASNIKGLRLEQHPTASNIKGLRLEQHPTASNIKGLRLEQHPTASNIKGLRLEQHPTASNIKGLRLEQHPTASNIKGLRLEQHPTDWGESATEKPWTSEEQKLLEQSLKTYPSSTPERWDRISEAVSTRTKKECMKRYKELVEMVKAKKTAQAAAAKAQ
eukprot:gene6191-6906_t